MKEVFCGRAASPLHGTDNPNRHLRIPVDCESCDGAHGVTRPAWAILDPVYQLSRNATANKDVPVLSLPFSAEVCSQR